MAYFRPTQQRIPPVPTVLERLRPNAQAANIAATMAHHRGLARAFNGLYDTVLDGGATPRRTRELIILRTGWNCQAEYEFGQHTLYGQANGLTPDEIYAVTRPLPAHAWSADDRLVLQMSDELTADLSVSDDTWQQLAARWSPPELIELVSTCLSYVLVSGLVNTLGLTLDDGVPGWPGLPAADEDDPRRRATS
jgi:alkylhydroperoxidase family enzyme